MKNIPRSTTEAEMRSLHNGIVDVQLRAMKWSHKSKQKNQSVVAAAVDHFSPQIFALS